MMEQSGLSDLVTDSRLVIPLGRLENIQKTDPRAFALLKQYLTENGFAIQTYIDDTPDIVLAAVKSEVGIPRIYHVDRKAGLSAAEPKDGYIKIASLDKMKELRQFLSNATNATISDSQSVGTIQNDDSQPI